MSLIIRLVSGMKRCCANPKEKEGNQSRNNVYRYKLKEKLAIYMWSMEYFCSLPRDKIHNMIRESG